MDKFELQKKTFDEQGFLVVDNALSQADLADFRRALQNVIDLTLAKAKRQTSKLTAVTAADPIDAGLLTLRKADPGYVTQVQRAMSRTPEFYRLSIEPEVMRLLQAIMNVPEERPLYITNNGILFTAPRVSEQRISNIELPWHNDVFHTIPRSNFVQIWAPLIHPATEAIGTLVVCPGSHKNGVGKQIFSPNDLFFYRYTIDPNEIKRYTPVPVELQLGQLLIFSGSLYHKSGVNVSDNVRCSIVAAYHDVGTAAFAPLSVEYKYLGQTPEGYYYELFGDPDALAIKDEQAAKLE